MRQIKILNLFGGVGGNRKRWRNVDITTVEQDEKIAAVYKSLFPKDVVVVGDAYKYLLNNYKRFDIIWASPPCQEHSRMIRSGRNRKPSYPDLKLYELILFLQYNFRGWWVVENVIPFYECLIIPTKIGRHLFWANFEIPMMPEIPEFKNIINRQNVEARKLIMDWLDIHFKEKIYYKENHDTTQVLRNCVHPDIGEYVFNFALRQYQLRQTRKLK